MLTIHIELVHKEETKQNISLDQIDKQILTIDDFLDALIKNNLYDVAFKYL